MHLCSSLLGWVERLQMAVLNSDDKYFVFVKNWNCIELVSWNKFSAKKQNWNTMHNKIQYRIEIELNWSHGTSLQPVSDGFRNFHMYWCCNFKVISWGQLKSGETSFFLVKDLLEISYIGTEIFLSTRQYRPVVLSIVQTVLDKIWKHSLSFRVPWKLKLRLLCTFVSYSPRKRGRK
jgi:hypothetical protein